MDFGAHDAGKIVADCNFHRGLALDQIEGRIDSEAIMGGVADITGANGSAMDHRDAGGSVTTDIRSDRCKEAGRFIPSAVVVGQAEGVMCELLTNGRRQRLGQTGSRIDP